MKMSLTVPLAMVLALAMVACGGENRSASAACATLIEIDAFEGDPDMSENEQTEFVLGLIDDFADQVPEDLAEDGETFSSGVRQVVEAQERDEELEEDPDETPQFAAAVNRLVAFETNECGSTGDLLRQWDYS